MTAAAAPEAAPDESRPLTETEILTSSLEQARKAGLVDLAEVLAKRLAKKKKESRVKNTALGQHLQQVGEMRRAKEKAEMQEAKASERAFKEADAEAQRKIAAAQLETERVRRETKVLEIQEKEKEEQKKKDFKETEQRAQRFQKGIARHVLSHLREKAAARDATARAALKEACTTPLVRKRGCRSAVAFQLPQFWRHDSEPESLGRYQDRVFRRVGEIQRGSGERLAVFASEEFEWALCGGTRMYAVRGHHGPADMITRALEQVCPRYCDVCGSRWPAIELLKEQHSCLDFAFLAGVWRYSRALGPAFPDGLPDCWPPPDTYL